MGKRAWSSMADSAEYLGKSNRGKATGFFNTETFFLIQRGKFL